MVKVLFCNWLKWVSMEGLCLHSAEGTIIASNYQRGRKNVQQLLQKKLIFFPSILLPWSGKQNITFRGEIYYFLSFFLLGHGKEKQQYVAHFLICSCVKVRASILLPETRRQQSTFGCGKPCICCKILSLSSNSPESVYICLYSTELCSLCRLW